MGKTYMLERVLAMRFNVVTLKMDGVYSTARRRAGIGQREVIRHPEMLTDGSIDGPLVDKFYSAFDRRSLGR
ncbi:MAG: hypothetical protein R2736_02550 [Solirubrobacterales bacterium]